MAYVIGSSLSRLGDGIYLVVLAWFALNQGHGSSRLATIMLVYTITQLICVLPAGWLSDLRSRYTLLILADVLRCLALILLSIPLLCTQLITLILFGIIFGIGSSLATPNEKPLLKSFIAQEQIPQANSLTSIIYPLCRRIIGPLLGGIIVALLSCTYGFIIDAITFLISIIFLIYLKNANTQKHMDEPQKNPAENSKNKTKASFTSTLCQPWVILCILGTFFGLVLNIGPVMILVPSLAKKISDAHGYGLIIAMGGIASIICSAIYGFMKIVRTYFFAFVFYAIASSALILFGMAHSVGMMGFATIVDEGFATIGSLLLMTATMDKGDNAVLGRLFAILSFVELSTAPISIFLVELLLHFYTMSSILLSAGILGFISMILMAGIALYAVDYKTAHLL